MLQFAHLPVIRVDDALYHAAVLENPPAWRRLAPEVRRDFLSMHALHETFIKVLFAVIGGL